MTGTGIQSYVERHEYRIANNSNLPQPEGSVQTATVEAEPTTVTYMGDEYPVFVPGVSDPEGTGADLHIIP